MLFRIFAPDDYVLHAKTRCKSVRCDNIPKMRKCDNATICVSQKRHKMGVYDMHNNFVTESGVKIRKKHMQKYRSIWRVPYMDCDVLFLGEVHWHFGHFLLEHTDRLWAAMSKPNVQKFVFVYNKNVGKIPKWLFEFTDMMGIARDDVLIVDRTTRFRSVLVPEVAVEKNVYSSLWAKTFRYMAENVDDAVGADKIYVSRNALKQRRTFGEKSVQKIFAKNGFDIIYPEKMGLKQQVAMIKNARVLAGCAGTALHLALFMKSGGRVVQIKRNSENADNCSAQYLICDACGHGLDLIWASAETEQTRHFTNVPQFISAGEYLQNWFNDNDFDVEKSDLKINKGEFVAYQKMLRWHRKRYGTRKWNVCKKKMIRLSACFIPVPFLKDKYYNYMKNRFVSM